MNVIDFHFVGPPCGRHGPYTFYRAFSFKKSGKYKTLTLGEFFLLQISKRELCVGELQLLWEDKNTHLSLSSSRLYFLPGDSNDIANDIAAANNNNEPGKDEVLAMSEKAVLKLEDLAAWTAAPTLSPEPSSTPPPSAPGAPNASNGHPQSPNMVNGKENNHPENGEMPQLKPQPSSPTDEEEKNGGEELERTKAVTVLSYPRYCRYRSVLKRLENAATPDYPISVLDALGDPSPGGRGHRVLFCRDTVERPDLERHPSFCNHLAPNLKGRPRKKGVKGWRGHSPSSESNASEDAKDNTKETLRLKLTKIKIQNYKIAAKQRSQKEILEEEEFLAKLFQFMRDRNSPIERVPHLGFKQINLYLFYTYAQNLGGYDKVTNKKMWKQIYDILGGSPGSTSAATCTRRHYERLLLPYERHQKGEEHKPLPPPVKHRRSSLVLVNATSTPDDDCKKDSEDVSEDTKDVSITLTRLNNLQDNSDGGATSMSTESDGPSSPSASITFPSNKSPMDDGADEKNNNAAEKESSSTPTSSRPHSAISTPSPYVDPKPVGHSVDEGAPETDIIPCSIDSTITTWIPDQSWKKQLVEIIDEKPEAMQIDVEKINEVQVIDTSPSTLHNSFPSSPTSFTDFLKQQKSMPQLYSFPAQEKNVEVEQQEYKSGNAGSSPPELSISISPPPVLQIQVTPTMLARNAIASPSPATPSPAPSIDHLPSPPPLVDLTRVVNALPVVQSDLKLLSEPHKNSETEAREHVSSPKRFRGEDAENIHPRISDVLPQRKDLGTPLEKVHPYSLPFLHLSQRHANEKVKMLTNFKTFAKQNSEQICEHHKHHLNASPMPLVARPSVIQHTQKTPPILEREKQDNANIHPYGNGHHHPVAAHQHGRLKTNGLVAATVGSNGSVQYSHLPYFQHPSAHSPNLSQPTFANGEKPNAKGFVVAPKYYPAPKPYGQPHGYRGSPYASPYCPPFENDDDQVLDLSLKKPKMEHAAAGKVSVNKTEPVQKPMPVPKYDVEYERITPPDKELDLSIKYDTPAKYDVPEIRVSPLLRCTSASGRQFPRGADNQPPPLPPPLREIETKISPPVVLDVGDERCKSDSDSPIDVTSVDIKSEPMGHEMSCNHPMCTSAHCYPYKQPYFPSGGSHLSSPYYNSTFFGFHPQFLVTPSRSYSPADHMQAGLAYKEIFPGLLSGHYPPYSLTSPLYQHLYKDSQPYLYHQPK